MEEGLKHYNRGSEFTDRSECDDSSVEDVAYNDGYDEAYRISSLKSLTLN
jgi:hypothetical protein